MVKIVFIQAHEKLWKKLKIEKTVSLFVVFVCMN